MKVRIYHFNINKRPPINLGGYKKQNKMSKSKNKNMHKFYCLMQLVLENLDDLKVTAPRMIQLKKDIIEMCELLNNEVADTYTIQKSTYFQEITKKIDTILRINFNENM